jgi:hypothetical protein
MDQEQRDIPRGDRAAAGILITAGTAVLAVAPILAAPWALEEGWQSVRFGLFALAVVAAWGLGGSAAAAVLRRLRGG